MFVDTAITGLRMKAGLGTLAGAPVEQSTIAIRPASQVSVPSRISPTHFLHSRLDKGGRTRARLLRMGSCNLHKHS